MPIRYPARVSGLGSLLANRGASSACTRHFGLQPKSNSPVRDTLIKFELPSVFAMSKMRFRNEREA